MDAGSDQCGAEVDGLLGRAALTVDGGGGRLHREPGLEPCVPGDVDPLLAELLHTARDDVLNLGGVDPGAVDQLGVGLREQAGGMDVLVVALLLVPAADREASGLDDHYLASTELSVVSHPSRLLGQFLDATKFRTEAYPIDWRVSQGSGHGHHPIASGWRTNDSTRNACVIDTCRCPPPTHTSGRRSPGAARSPAGSPPAPASRPRRSCSLARMPRPGAPRSRRTPSAGSSTAPMRGG